MNSQKSPSHKSERFPFVCRMNFWNCGRGRLLFLARPFSSRGLCTGAHAPLITYYITCFVRSHRCFFERTGSAHEWVGKLVSAFLSGCEWHARLRTGFPGPLSPRNSIVFLPLLRLRFVNESFSLLFSVFCSIALVKNSWALQIIYSYAKRKVK